MCREEAQALCPKTLTPTHLPHMQWVATFTSIYFNWDCYCNTNCQGISTAGLHVHTKRTEQNPHHLCNTNMFSLAFSPQAKVLLSNTSRICRIAVMFEQPPKPVNTKQSRFQQWNGNNGVPSSFILLRIYMLLPPKQGTTWQVSSNSGRTYKRDHGQ